MNFAHLPRVTTFFAVKLADKNGMGGYIDLNTGDCSIRGQRTSTDRIVVERAIELAVRKHPDWIVELRSSTALACMYN